jgi:hypothetical protein
MKTILAFAITLALSGPAYAGSKGFSEPQSSDEPHAVQPKPYSQRNWWTGDIEYNYPPVDQQEVENRFREQQLDLQRRALQQQRADSFRLRQPVTCTGTVVVTCY